MLLSTAQVLDHPILAAGDACCDSMGHCAKYGSYTIVDLERNKIIAMDLYKAMKLKLRIIWNWRVCSVAKKNFVNMALTYQL
jgi:hypothetical protein